MHTYQYNCKQLQVSVVIFNKHESFLLDLVGNWMKVLTYFSMHYFDIARINYEFLKLIVNCIQY